MIFSKYFYSEQKSIEKSGVLSKQGEGLPNITASGVMRNVDYNVTPAITNLAKAFSQKITYRNIGYTDSKVSYGGSYNRVSYEMFFNAANGETKTDGRLKTDDDGKVYGKSDHVTPENFTIRIWLRTA